MANTTPQTPDHTAEKRRFAALLLKYPNKSPETHALAVFPSDSSNAIRAGAHWPTDPAVRQYMSEIMAEQGAQACLTDRDETAHEILNIARTHADNPHGLKAFELYCEVRGFTGKGSTQSDDDVSQALNQLYTKIQGSGRPKPKGAR